MNTIAYSSITPVFLPAAAGPALDADSAPRVVTTGATRKNPLPQELFNSRRPWDAASILAGVVAIDWLTLTTWDHTAFAWAVHILADMTPPAARADAKFLQYYGCSGDGYFFGSGIQDTQEHFLLRLSGSLAHMFIREALSRNKHDYLLLFKCTRIDVQYTYPQALDVDLPALKDYLRVADWPLHRARRPIIDIIDKDDGFSTLYIGSRKESVRMQRLYVKKVGSEKLFRWETEYKQELSISLWSNIIEHGLDFLPPVLAGEISIVPGDFAAHILQLLETVPDRLRLVKLPSDELRTLAWLYRSVAPAVRRLRSSDDSAIAAAAADFLVQSLAADLLPRFVPPARSVDEWLFI